MNHEVEREVGELAKLRLFYERVMALRRFRVGEFDEGGGYMCDYADEAPDGDWVRAADIDEALKEVGSE